MANWMKKRRLACEPVIAVEHPLFTANKDMFCWGSNIHGELGLGGIEDENIFIPRKVNFHKATEIVQIGCGENYTVVLTRDGELYSCGNNDYGQLGHINGRKRLMLIPSLDVVVFKKLACGAYHTVAVNELGELFIWGSNAEGQLGLNSETAIGFTPHIVATLWTRAAVQVACGAKHTLALMNNGDLYSWGSNSEGQLGLGLEIRNKVKPNLVTSLALVPIAFIACGGYHSIAITKSGAVYGWGKNTFGQLGLNDTQDKYLPCQLRTLRNAKVCYAACGEAFSVFLTMDGRVFTCGAGMYGQLGHGSNTNEILPRQVMELMGSVVTQISCGKRHTLALVPSQGTVYAWGLGGAGQLGSHVVKCVFSPQIVHGPWDTPSESSVIDLDKQIHSWTHDCIVKHIFTGGDHSFVTVTSRKDNIEADDCRTLEPSYHILAVTEEQLIACEKIPQGSSIDFSLKRYLKVVFKSQACINGSFLLNNDAHYGCSSKHHGVDFDQASRLFGIIRELDNSAIQELIFTCVSDSLIHSFVSSPPDVESLRIYLTLPLYHGFANPLNCKKLHEPFCNAVFALATRPSQIVTTWWVKAPVYYFERLVRIHKSVVLHYVKQSQPKKSVPQNPTLHVVLNMLHLLNRLNCKRDEGTSLHFSTFHIPELVDLVDISGDYIRRDSSVVLFSEYPFLLNAEAKTILLETHQSVQMQSAMHAAAVQAAMHNYLLEPWTATTLQFVTLNVSRENIVGDTVMQLSNYGPMDLKRPLRVKFHGEEAEDEGGVKKEFFMLLLKEILDPKYGMFKQYEETRTIWFIEDSFEDEVMYNLIGTVCGLAIYNVSNIYLSFPLALYKKLLHESVGLIDIKDMSPVLAKSMQDILDYEESDFEDVFGINFEVVREAFGEKRIYELIPGGSKVPVTLENKKQFVDLYVDYILNKSVEVHFQEFYKGFHNVCGGPILELFHSTELMALVAGSEDYDWEELEKNAMYKEGYTKNDPTIILFWQVFRELPLEEKKKFLLFLTGCDRIPIQGMKAIRILIQPLTDERLLPVAHTCFNLLDLPRYQTRERLRYKLLQAIQQTHGFSLL